MFNNPFSVPHIEKAGADLHFGLEELRVCVFCASEKEAQICGVKMVKKLKKRFLKRGNNVQLTRTELTS